MGEGRTNGVEKKQEFEECSKVFGKGRGVEEGRGWRWGKREREREIEIFKVWYIALANRQS